MHGNEFRCEIVKASNGYIVAATRPYPEMPARAGGAMTEYGEFLKKAVDVLPDLNALGGRGAVQGMDEAIEPWKENAEDADQPARVTEDKKQKLKEKIEKVFGPKPPEIGVAGMEPPLFKAHEVFVFMKLVDALAFIAKEMEPPVEGGKL
jgi:hypothetical protein